jgi:N-acetylglucosaminyl-diphospho-decaprenol L-rhamnosyltransferase
VAEACGARVVHAGANVGFGAGCNLGAAAGSAPYVLLLNPDAAAEPGTVAGLAAALARHPRAAAIASEVGDEPVRRRFPTLLRAPLEPGVAGRLDERWYRRHPGPVEWLSAPCLLLRRDAFDEVGGFDERYFLYWEEVDLAKRLQAAGWELRWVPGFPARHESGGSGAGRAAWAAGLVRWAGDHAGRPTLLRRAVAFGLVGRAVVWRVLGRREKAASWWDAARAVV